MNNRSIFSFSYGKLAGSLNYSFFSSKKHLRGVAVKANLKVLDLDAHFLRYFPSD